MGVGLAAAGVVVASNRLGAVPDAGLKVAGRRPPGVGAGVDMNIKLARQSRLPTHASNCFLVCFRLEKPKFRTLP